MDDTFIYQKELEKKKAVVCTPSKIDSILLIIIFCKNINSSTDNKERY